MALPSVDNVQAPDSAVPGEPFDVFIVASDPDSDILTLEARVTDSQGNVGTATVDVPVDVLTYELIDVNASGSTIAQDPNDKTHFTVTPPAAA